jgi:hypothetical protein
VICLSPIHLGQLGALLGPLKLSIPLPNLPNLPALQHALALSVPFPPLPPLPPLPALTIDPLHLSAFLGLAGGLHALRVGLGIDLLAPRANLQLAAFAKSVGLHLPALLGLSLSLPPLPLIQLANLVLSVKAILGINLLQAGLVLPPLPPLPPLPVIPPLLLRLALLIHAVQLGFGINLLVPGAVLKLSAALSLLATLTIPTLSLSLPALGNLMLMVTALGLLKLAFGISFGGSLTPVLNLALRLQIPPLPPLPPLPLILPPLPDLKMLAGLNLAGLNLGLALPSLGLFPMLASLVAAVNANLGINLLCPCPLGFL